MIVVVCTVCGMGIGVKEGGDSISHGLCPHCEAVVNAEEDAIEIARHDANPVQVVAIVNSAYRWRATANVLKFIGWTFPPQTFVGDDTPVPEWTPQARQ